MRSRVSLPLVVVPLVVVVVIKALRKGKTNWFV
jgi:hypothetical protein